MNEIIPFDNVPYVDPSARADEAAVLASQMGGQQQTGNFMFLTVGSGATSFKVDPDGMWLGSEVMADAPFSADMLGNVILNSVLINGLAGDTLAGAFDESGNIIAELITATLDTQAKKILGEYTFEGSGAIAIKTDANNGIWFSPTGILAKKAGANTFAIDIEGNATFGGTLVAASGALGAITIGNNAWKVDSSGNMWWGASSTYAGATIKISAAGAITFTTGTFSGAISGSTISGATITGSTFKANGGAGVDVWIANDGYIRFRYGSANKAYLVSDSSGNLVIDADETLYVQAGNELSLVFNEGGGGNNFYLWDNSTLVMFATADEDVFIPNGNLEVGGSVQCGSTFKSSDGTAGVDKGPYGFVTAVESSRAKFREITTKDGLVTNIGGESGWL